MSDEVSRRSYLQVLLATSVATGIAGCNSSQNKSNPESTAEKQTPTPNQAPKILANSATPQDNGSRLAVQLEGKDDRGLEKARIEYGGKSVEETPNSASVELDGEFTNLGTVSLDTTPGQVTFLLRDTDGKETRAAVTPDETAPQLRTFTAKPTENAGEISLVIEGRDNVGLKELRVILGEKPQLQEKVSGQTQTTLDTVVDVSAISTTGEVNTPTGIVKDWNSNTTQSDAETYVRKYDVLKDTKLDIGANYFPAGEQMFTRCLEEGVVKSPLVGVENYGNPITPWVTSRHIDQMQGHGIGRLQMNYEGPITNDDVETLFNAELADEIEIEPTYFVQKARRWSEDADAKTVLKEDMTYIKEQFFGRENVATIDKRPVFTIENAMSFIGYGVDEIWGSFEAFVDDMRSYLSVDGIDPFIVGGFGSSGYRGGGYAGSGWPHEKLATQFDAVTNTLAAQTAIADRGEDISWGEYIEYKKENCQGHRNLAEMHDMEFVPRAIPGHNDTANTCWGSDQVIPRSPRHFHEDLKIAAEYGTLDRVNIFTWNDFTEGTAIEPGTFHGNNYATAYLEVIENYQKNQ